MENFERLCEIERKIQRLEAAKSLIEWDQEVTMPPGSADSHSAIIGELAGVIHQTSTSPQLRSALETSETLLLSQPTSFTPFDASTIRESRRGFDRFTKLPVELFQKFTEVQSKGQAVWNQALESGDLQAICPYLKQFVDLWKEIARYLAPTGSATTYDSILNINEFGLTQKRSEELLSSCKTVCKRLLDKMHSNGIFARNSKDDQWIKNGLKFDLETQESFCRLVATDMGFDWSIGRLDRSVHPFSVGISRNDVRITNRFKENDLFEGLMSVIHESGHGLYEQGLNPKFSELPSGSTLHTVMHEGQALLWERIIGQSRPFWKKYSSKINELFPNVIPNSITDESWYRAINVVRPSVLRIGSDEITYHLHIAIRCEIEQELLDGTLICEPEVLRHAWNEKMKSYLGILPKNDKEGFLQDTHWGSGMFGYFPSYTIGTLASFQVAETMFKSHPIESIHDSPNGMKEMREWLRENIQQWGRLDDNFDGLLNRVTGKPLDICSFSSSLEKKYSDLYDI